MNNITDINNYRLEKEDKQLGRGVIYISHEKGTATGKPSWEDSDSGEFAARIQNIRESLARINKLMEELKEVSGGIE